MKRSSLCLAIGLIYTVASVSVAKEIVLYSTRAAELIQPIIDVYQKESGNTVKIISDKGGVLIERLKSEGVNTPADLLLTVDAGNLWQAAELGLFQTNESQTLQHNIPAYLRDPKQQWFGLTIRARTIFYNPNTVKAEQLSSYEALAEPQWKGKLCLRTAKAVYNQSLIAMHIADIGEEKTENMVKGWVANLAAPVFPDDTKLLRAIATGQCDVGITNSYYYGRLMDDSPDLPIKLFWANQASHGTHVNITGAGIIKQAKNVEGAKDLLDWLSGNTAQSLFAESGFEYPVNQAVPANAAVVAWGPFKQNQLNVVNAGRLQAQAVMLMDRAGFK